MRPLDQPVAGTPLTVRKRSRSGSNGSDLCAFPAAHFKDRREINGQISPKQRNLDESQKVRSASPLILSSPMEISDDELDENGFPVAPLLSSGHDAGEEATSFAEAFYKSGTDLSCLAEKKEKEKKGDTGRGLVQKDLFQMWGIKKPPSEESTSMSVFPSPPRKRGRMIGGVGTRSRDDGSVGQKDIEKGRKGVGSGYDRPRICPFYKKMPGTPFTVDAFRYGLIEGCSAYFLTHFHHDHYGGLSKRWSHGPIYCTLLTARLVKMCLSVDPRYICPLELETECEIEGIKVTMLEANHCPGAALIHFRLSDGRSYLHTGDFRASKLMQSHPILMNQRINVLYLDTTYCNPKYRFPPKEDVVDFVVRVTRKCLQKEPRTLVVVGAYSIGKEHVYLGISQALGVQIFANASRRRILQSFGWPELSGKLCSRGDTTPLHVVPISFLRLESLKQYFKTYAQQYKEVLAFRPTGWTYSETHGTHLDQIKPNIKDQVTIYGVPYSEHSSFTELREFVKFLRPEKIIPTVNVGNAAKRDTMQSYFRDWLRS